MGFKVKQTVFGQNEEENKKTEAKQMKDKNIADHLKQNKSEAIKCLFGKAKESKKNNKDIIGMPSLCGKDGNIKLVWRIRSELWKCGTKKSC